MIYLFLIAFPPSCDHPCPCVLFCALCLCVRLLCLPLRLPHADCCPHDLLYHASLSLPGCALHLCCTNAQGGVQHRRNAQPGRERLGTGDREGSNQRDAGAREDTKADAQAQGAGHHTGTGMITRGRKRNGEESGLSKERLRDQGKRAKDIGKRVRGAKPESRRPTHQGEATGAVVVTQTKKGVELTSRKSHTQTSREKRGEKCRRE